MLSEPSTTGVAEVQYIAVSRSIVNRIYTSEASGRVAVGEPQRQSARSRKRSNTDISGVLQPKPFQNCVRLAVGLLYRLNRNTMLLTQLGKQL